jgi:DNA-binding NtrC family response regulator
LQSDRHLSVEHLHVRPVRPTVLLVDDDNLQLHELEQILAPDSYFVLKADSGDNALDLMARNAVNVVISDNRMPGMTGLEMLEKLRVRHPETSCILLSGLTTVDMLMTAVNRGDVYRVLAKPCEPTALRQAVAEALRHSLGFGERPAAQLHPPTGS